MRARIFPDESSLLEQKPFLPNKSNSLLSTWDRKRVGGRGPSNRIYSAHSIKEKPTSVWTVRWPKRMLYSILGVFLAIPLLIFGWKETHTVHSHHDLIDGNVHPRFNTELSDRDRLRATWMEDGATEEQSLDANAAEERIASPAAPPDAQTTNSTEIGRTDAVDATNKTTVLVDTERTVTSSEPTIVKQTSAQAQNTETSAGLRGALEQLQQRDTGNTIASLNSGNQ